MRLSHMIAGAVAALSMAAPAVAQETVAIVGGRILTGTSVIDSGTVVIRDGRLTGENTDGQGFVASLRTVADPAGQHVVVLGAGGLR